MGFEFLIFLVKNKQTKTIKKKHKKQMYPVFQHAMKTYLEISPSPQGGNFFFRFTVVRIAIIEC